MSSKFLHYLVSGAAGNFGNNLLYPPSRIVPLTFQDMDDTYEENIKVLRYLTPSQEEAVIYCKPGFILPEPSAYFVEPHSFLESVLYLVLPEFYSISTQPRKKDAFLARFIRDTFDNYLKHATQKEIRPAKKLMQHLLHNEWGEYDTDPSKNQDFATFIKVISTVVSDQIIIIHSDQSGHFQSTTPETVPSVDIVESDRRFIVLCQLPNSRFAPYGIGYLLSKA